MSNPSEEWAAKLKIVEKTSDGSTTTRIIRRTATDFKFERELGEGSYSTVMLACDIHTGKNYAIKVLDKRHIVKEKKVKYVNIEKDSLNILGRHNGIVHLFFTFQDEYSLYYVLDYAPNGELLSLIKKYGSLNEDVTRYYAAQIMDALKYIHNKGIIHRDLKPENILLDKDFKVQITDFGTARLLTKDEATGKFVDDGRAKSFVGTAEYVSPELLKDKSVGKPCDIWALGCIIFQLIAGKPPFKATNDYLIFQQVMKVKYAFSAGFPTIIRDLVKRILVANPDERPTVKDLEKHLFFQGINFKNPEKDIWYSPPPTFSPYKMSSQAMKPIPELENSSIVRPRMKSTGSSAKKSNSPGPSFTSSLEYSPSSVNNTPKRNISANAAAIALTKLTLQEGGASIKTASSKRKVSKDHKRQNSVPAGRRGQDLKMKYHNDDQLTSIAGTPASSSESNNNNNISNNTTNSKPKRSVSLPPSPLINSTNASFPRPPTSRSSTSRPASPQLASPKVFGSTSSPKTPPTKPTRPSRKPPNYADNTWAPYLQPHEHVLRTGVVYIKFLTTENFEKRFKGKTTNSPLYYKGKRLGSAGGNSYSLLTQMVHGNGKSGLRGDALNSDGSITSGSSSSGKGKSELDITGIINYVKTPDIEEIEAELDQNVNNNTNNNTNVSGGGVFKKFTKNLISGTGISSLVASNQPIEFRASRMILVTSMGRMLILGRRPGSTSEDPALKYQVLTEINLSHPSIRFKEILSDIPVSSDDYGNNSPLSSPTSNSNNDFAWSLGVFAVITYSITTLVRVEKQLVNSWTECLTESRYGGLS